MFCIKNLRLDGEHFCSGYCLETLLLCHKKQSRGTQMQETEGKAEGNSFYFQD